MKLLTKLDRKVTISNKFNFHLFFCLDPDVRQGAIYKNVLRFFW